MQTYSLSVGICAVPERFEQAWQLNDEVLSHKLVRNSVVVYDGKPGTPQRIGSLANHVKAAQAAWVTHSSHVIVLEDDAVICGDFAEHALRMIARAPDKMIGLYCGRKFPMIGQEFLAKIDSEWDGVSETLLESDLTAKSFEDRKLELNMLCAELRWGVGFIIPSDRVMEWAADLALERFHRNIGADTRLGRMFSQEGQVAYAWPSLVNHRDTDTIIGTTAEPGERVAWEFCQH